MRPASTSPCPRPPSPWPHAPDGGVDQELLAEAARQRGYPGAPTPVTLALVEQTRFGAAHWVEDLVVELVEWQDSGRVYRYSAPPELRAFLAAWSRGERVEPAKFTLVLIPGE